jgi:hypothetical protein
MDFLKDLLKIQHKLIIDELSSLLLNEEIEINNFKNKYNKNNYSLIKISNCNIIDNRVKSGNLLYNLKCDHNPS